MSWDVDKKEVEEAVKEGRVEWIWSVYEWLRNLAVRGECPRCSYVSDEKKPNEDQMTKLIHYCCMVVVSHEDEADIIYVKCLPWGGNYSGNTEISNVFDADFDDNLWSVFYTFEKDKVTCKTCLDKMK